MEFWHALILGAVEGITEFLPISSTGHLTIVEKLLGLPLASPGVTAFTAIVQLGAIAAVILFFRKDIIRLAGAWGRGVRRVESRHDPDYRFAWLVIAGSIPIGIVGFLARDLILGGLRNLWVVVAGLVLWSIVMVIAERIGTQTRTESSITLKDTLFIGALQCLALVPGVSRSGATISAGLLTGLTRVTATRLSFFLAIPALVAAGAYEGVTEAGAIAATVGWIPTLMGTAVSFVVAYVSIAWLLRLVAHHSISVFVVYRLGVAALVTALLVTGAISST